MTIRIFCKLPYTVAMFPSRCASMAIFRAPIIHIGLIYSQKNSHALTTDGHEAAQLPLTDNYRPNIVLNLFAFTVMSHNQSAAAGSSNFQLLINNALDTYRKRTKNDLLTHPLAAQLQACDTPVAILTILREQIHWLDRSQSGAERWSKWLDPTVNVLFTFSATIGAGVSLVWLRTCTLPRSAFSYSFGRYFLPPV